MDTEFSYILKSDNYSQDTLNKIQSEMLKVDLQHKRTDYGLFFKRQDYDIVMSMKNSALGKSIFN